MTRRTCKAAVRAAHPTAALVRGNVDGRITYAVEIGGRVARPDVRAVAHDQRTAWRFARLAIEGGAFGAGVGR